VPLLLLVVAMASVGSHMPARYRHYSLLHCSVVEPGQSLCYSVPTGQTEKSGEAEEAGAHSGDKVDERVGQRGAAIHLGHQRPRNIPLKDKYLRLPSLFSRASRSQALVPREKAQFTFR